MSPVEDAISWLVNMVSSQPSDILIKMVTILWGVWFFKNKRVWENRFVSAKVAMKWSK